MTWTIIILVLAILLYVGGAMALSRNDKKAMTGNVLTKKLVSLIAGLLIIGCVCRLYVPYYLTAVNPGIVQEMVTAMQEQQNAEKNKAVRKYVRDNVKEMVGDAPVMGNPEAAKTIFVWTDFSCPYCRRVHGELERVLADRDDVRVVVKNFSIHGALSDGPARAVIAAKMQSPEKAAALVNKLMNNEYYSRDDMKDQAKLPGKVEKGVMKFAKEAGLDTTQLKKDMESDTVARELRNVRELAQRFEINGTPFLIIGEQSYPGAIPYAQIVEALK